MALMTGLCELSAITPSQLLGVPFFSRENGIQSLQPSPCCPPAHCGYSTCCGQPTYRQKCKEQRYKSFMLVAFRRHEHHVSYSSTVYMFVTIMFHPDGNQSGSFTGHRLKNWPSGYIPKCPDAHVFLIGCIAACVLSNPTLVQSPLASIPGLLPPTNNTRDL